MGAFLLTLTIMFYLLIILFFVAIAGIKQINQYERGVKFMLGKYRGIMAPGWRIVWPVIQSYRKVDIRVKAVDVPDQDAITRDNVSTRINAVIYYKIAAADRAVLEVENFFTAVSQLAQTTMRNVVGQVTLDELLSERDKISENIKTIIEKSAVEWGVEVANVELKDIALPEEMKRVIAKQAEAEREKRAVITQSEGEVAAAENLRRAAEVLGQAPGALHLRTLSTINDVSSDQSNTLIFAVPVEILRSIESMGRYFDKKSEQ